VIERSRVRLPAGALPGIASVNSAFHPSEVGKSSTSLLAGVKHGPLENNLEGHGLRRGAFTCVGWQVTLCDPMWQVTPRSSVMGSSHEELYAPFYCLIANQ